MFCSAGATDDAIDDIVYITPSSKTEINIRVHKINEEFDGTDDDFVHPTTMPVLFPGGAVIVFIYLIISISKIRNSSETF